MRIEYDDLDYPLIDVAFKAHGTVSKGWSELERVYRNIADKQYCDDLKDANRSHVFVPIARDTVLIKRSIFSSSFMIDQFALTIREVGDEDSERARQLRLASKYYWDKTDPFVEINKAMLRMLILPIGVVQLYYDLSRDKYTIEETNPMDIAFDPDARNHNDNNFFAYRYKKTGKEIRLILKADGKKKKKEKFYNMSEGHLEYFGSKYDDKNFRQFDRYDFEEIYIKEDGYWFCKTYSRGFLMRVYKFLDSPFFWGFIREQISSVEESRRDGQIMTYGESDIDFIKEHVRALNTRRNQHSDIIEKQINPDVFVGTGAKVNVKDLNSGGGRKIPCQDINQIQNRPTPTTMGLHDDMSMFKDDIENTTSINGNQRGVTSTSDRRPTGAIALLSSQSSTRVEEQIVTANNTLFSHLAKSFVKKVYRNTPIDVLKKLGIDEPMIGREFVDSDDDFDLIVKVDFGSDNKRAEKAAAIWESLQTLGQFQNVDQTKVEKLAEKGLKLRLGDEEEAIDGIFNPVQGGAEAAIPMQEELPPTVGGGI